MQRHVVAGAPIGELGAGGTIDVDLPGYRREGFEVVVPIDGYPRQSVAAMDVAGSADAQRTIAVIQGDLRNRPEEVLASRLEGHRCGDQHGSDARTNDVGDPAFRG